MRIKQFHTFVSFTILGLFVQSGLCDISLTLRNGVQGSGPGYGRSRKTYLPPPVKPVQHKTEEYYRIQEEHVPVANQHQHQHQQQFQESSYGNARYQIFEVHNHYETSSKHHGAAPQAVVHIKHINSGIAPAAHPAVNDNHLDISYLSFAANEGPNGEQITIHEQLPPPPAPPVSQVTPNVPVAFPSNYQHGFQNTRSNAGVVSQRHIKQVSQGLSREPYKGPDYLPPYKQGPSDSLDASASARGVDYRAPDYLPPHTGAPPPAQQYLAPQVPQQQNIAINAHNTNHQNQFKGPDYLPPHHSGPAQAPANNVAYQVSSSASGVSGAYHAPDYLPPHGGSQVQQPQLQRFQHQQAPNLNVQHVEHHQHLQQSAAISSVYNGPDYLPPHQEKTQPSFKGPDYLPPHGTVEAILGHHQHIAQQSLPAETPQRAPGFLPAGYDFNNPEEKQFQQQQHHQHFDQHVQVQQSPLQYQENVPVATQFSHPVPTQGSLGTPGTLPPGYEFDKPDNAEQAIAELHGQAPPSQPHQQQLPQSNYQTHQHLQQQPLQQQPLHHQHVQQQPLQQHSLQLQPLQQEPLQHQHVQQQRLQDQPLQQQHFVPSSVQQQQHLQVAIQSQIQVANNNVPVPDILHVEQRIPTPPEAHSTYQADPAGYLPPHVDSQPHQQQAAAVPVNYAAPVPQYEQPYIAQQQQPLQEYHSEPQQQQQFNQQQHMHSLSSYMTTVQPYERYGDAQFTTSPRKPFDTYGPPPVTTPLPFLQQQQQQSFVDVAPMYREPTARPHAYAPTMSYTENPVPAAYTSYTLNEQTKQQLQQFMPKEIQQQQQQQHSAAAPTSGKIRTVQIVNPNTVKTLKVLETSDHAGVRTIKILGPSNESPMGEHRVVNVVSQSGADGQENHVQTVKIYNDQQDVTIGATGTAVAIGTTGNNAYLPPAGTAVAVNKKRLVRDSHHLQAQPRRRISKESNNRRYRQRF